MPWVAWIIAGAGHKSVMKPEVIRGHRIHDSLSDFLLVLQITRREHGSPSNSTREIAWCGGVGKRSREEIWDLRVSNEMTDTYSYMYFSQERTGQSENEPLSV